MKQPKGVACNGDAKIAVRLPAELFRKLVRRGEKQGTGFSDTVADVLKCGFLCIEESERDEEQAA